MVGHKNLFGLIFIGLCLSTFTGCNHAQDIILGKWKFAGATSPPELKDTSTSGFEAAMANLTMNNLNLNFNKKGIVRFERDGKTEKDFYHFTLPDKKHLNLSRKDHIERYFIQYLTQDSMGLMSIPDSVQYRFRR